MTNLFFVCAFYLAFGHASIIITFVFLICFHSLLNLVIPGRPRPSTFWGLFTSLCDIVEITTLIAYS